MLRLLGVGTLQQVSGRAPVPEVAVGEFSGKTRVKHLIQIKYRKFRRIGVSLRYPLAGPIAIRSGIRDHRKIDRRDRPAKRSEEQVAGSAGPILKGGHGLVVIQQAT